MWRSQQASSTLGKEKSGHLCPPCIRKGKICPRSTLKLPFGRRRRVPPRVPEAGQADLQSGTTPQPSWERTATGLSPDTALPLSAACAVAQVIRTRSYLHSMRVLSVMYSKILDVFTKVRPSRFHRGHASRFQSTRWSTPAARELRTWCASTAVADSPRAAPWPSARPRPSIGGSGATDERDESAPGRSHTQKQRTHTLSCEVTAALAPRNSVKGCVQAGHTTVEGRPW
jgi:hypothetical protein